MIICTRKIEFDAAHRIKNHESKCKMLHGHRYVLEASFEAPQLDSLGRVIDFGVIKEILGAWIDENFDHNTILSQDDVELGQKIEEATGQRVFYLKNHPTAENIGIYLYEEICPKLFSCHEIKCTKIKIYETPNCHVEIS
jgi:6-pyruvoyltetrahydropterin/6-carboxytetrahydropterin synthase